MVDQPFVAHRVAVIGRVLATIDFDHEAVLTADEIDDERADRLLTDELVPKGAGPNAIPKAKLGFGRICSKLPSPIRLDIVGSTHVQRPPHPTRFARRPLPASGER